MIMEILLMAKAVLITMIKVMIVITTTMKLIMMIIIAIYACFRYFEIGATAPWPRERRCKTTRPLFGGQSAGDRLLFFSLFLLPDCAETWITPEGFFFFLIPAAYNRPIVLGGSGFVRDQQARSGRPRIRNQGRVLDDLVRALLGFRGFGGLGAKIGPGGEEVLGVCD